MIIIIMERVFMIINIVGEKWRGVNGNAIGQHHK